MRKARLLFACLGVLAASGCASIGAPTPTVARADDDTDYQKIHLVDQWAARNNVTVVWVNRPTRKQPAVVSQ